MKIIIKKKAKLVSKIILKNDMDLKEINWNWYNALFVWKKIVFNKNSVAEAKSLEKNRRLLKINLALETFILLKSKKF